MRRQKFTTILGAVLAFACVARPGLAQTQTSTCAQPSGDQSQSAAALAQQATNPFSSSWLMQVQQNNNWIDMPFGHDDRIQSNLQFQPLMSVSLTKDWGLAGSPQRRRPDLGYSAAVTPDYPGAYQEDALLNALVGS